MKLSICALPIYFDVDGTRGGVIRFVKMRTESRGDQLTLVRLLELAS